MSDDLLKEVLNYARQNYIPVMLDDTRALLKSTAEKYRPRKILEIGTAVGYSGIIMLTASPDATLNTVEIDEDTANTAKQNFIRAGVWQRVNLFVGDAREIVRSLTGKYDFIFLDGPKGQYDVFLPYLSDVLDVGGVLFCDNVLYKGLVENVPEDKRHKHITIARNLKKFLDDIFAEPTLETKLYRIGDGVTVSVKLAEENNNEIHGF
ncbi:MAG: O-methyltransferase [Corallococcus sp.]|nr:O-methyltransferase [Corallococcus sp.]